MNKIQLLNLSTGEPVEVDDESLPSAVASGKFGIPKDIDLEFEDTDGERRVVPGSQAFDAFNAGFKYIPKRQVEREEKLQMASEKPFVAGAVGALRGLTLGLSDQIIKQTGAMTEEELKLLEEANPAITTVSDIAGTVLPTLATGGTGLGARALAATPAALAELAGRKAALKLSGKLLSSTTSNVVQNAVKLGVGSAVEGSLYGVGKLISEDALGDAEFNAESALASLGRGALEGGAFGGVIGGVGTKLQKATDAAIEALNGKVKDLAERGDAGILKWAGAEKRHFGKILDQSNLTEKEMIDHAMSLVRGFDDTAESIAATGKINNSGNPGLKNLLFTNSEDMIRHNEIAKDGAVKTMTDSVQQLTNDFESTSAKLKSSDLVYGSDLAQRIENEVLLPMKDIYSPRKAEIKKLVDEIAEIGVVRNELGDIIAKKPLTPAQLRQQSIEFGELAKFEKRVPTGKEEVFRDLRKYSEDKLIAMMDKIDDGRGLSSKYKEGKKLYQKSVLLEEILENGVKKAQANNRGMSITEGLAGVAGGAVGGVPGAIAGYALRKGQREYGDKLASYVFGRIERSSNKGKIAVSDAVDGFFKAGENAGFLTRKAALKTIIGRDVENEKEIEDKISYYSQDPAQMVDKFVQNNDVLIKSAPKTAQALQSRMIKAAEFLKSKLPEKNATLFDDAPITRVEKQKFKNYVEAVEKPYKSLETLKQGYITPEAVEAFKVVYPSLFNSLKQEFSQRLPEFKKITEKQKAELSRLLGLNAKRAYTPEGFMVLQGVSRQGVQQGIKEMNKVSYSAAKNLNQSNRNQTGIDKVLNRA